MAGSRPIFSRSPLRVGNSASLSVGQGFLAQLHQSLCADSVCFSSTLEGDWQYAAKQKSEDPNVADLDFGLQISFVIWHSSFGFPPSSVPFLKEAELSEAANWIAND
jgi:hypothetical protein